jgi:hypothetical protein
MLTKHAERLVSNLLGIWSVQGWKAITFVVLFAVLETRFAISTGVHGILMWWESVSDSRCILHLSLVQNTVSFPMLVICMFPCLHFNLGQFNILRFPSHFQMYTYICSERHRTIPALPVCIYRNEVAGLVFKQNKTLFSPALNLSSRSGLETPAWKDLFVSLCISICCCKKLVYEGVLRITQKTWLLKVVHYRWSLDFWNIAVS